ncbi:glycosyltransferase family 2 protein [Haloimpatiens sp. FM7330]|uniref:glycosyltransferase family 2 protein n=1 Tax=Haloimpatiens sp. FM7330 TaxID=3298610 RepID=UPI0036335322
MISIIIPVFNAEKYLKRCLESVISQSYTEIEVILVDDGSSDRSKLICEEYRRKDSRIKTIFNSNAGPGFSRNYGLEMAMGDYIYFMDADDELLPEALQENYRIAVEKNLDVIIFAYSIINYVNGHPKTENICSYKNTYVTTNDEIKLMFWNLFKDGLIAPVWNKFYKKDFIIKNGIRFTDLRKGQDAVFNFEILKYVNSMYINENVYYKYHFYNSNNITSRYTPMLFSIFTSYHKKLDELIDYWKIYDEYSCKKNNQLYFIHISVCISNLVKIENNNLIFREKIDACKKILNNDITKKVLNNIKLSEIENMYHKICFLLMRSQNSYLNIFFYEIIRKIKKYIRI